jgi:hypothetical protein
MLQRWLAVPGLVIAPTLDVRDYTLERQVGSKTARQIAFLFQCQVFFHVLKSSLINLMCLKYPHPDAGPPSAQLSTFSLSHRTT